MAMATFQKNSIFTNVAETSEGRVYWEGLEDEIRGRDDIKITDWLGNPWKLGDPTPAAHPNSLVFANKFKIFPIFRRFCAPAKQCPIIHHDWESPSCPFVWEMLFSRFSQRASPLMPSFSGDEGPKESRWCLRRSHGNMAFSRVLASSQRPRLLLSTKVFFCNLKKILKFLFRQIGDARPNGYVRMDVFMFYAF